MLGKMSFYWMTFSRMTFSRMTFSRMTFSRMTFSVMTSSAMAFRKMTFSRMTIYRMTFSKIALLSLTCCLYYKHIKMMLLESSVSDAPNCDIIYIIIDGAVWIPRSIIPRPKIDRLPPRSVIKSYLFPDQPFPRFVSCSNDSPTYLTDQ